MVKRRIKHYQNMREIEVDKIHFLQKTITSTFTNGMPISWTIEMLEKNEILPRELPLIRIGWFKERWTSIDNRRLYCFKQSKNIDIIPVRIVKHKKRRFPQRTKKINNDRLDVKVNVHKNRKIKVNEKVIAFDPISS